MAQRVIELRAPIGGINSRMAFQKQPPFTTVDASNVRPDGPISERTRIGSRPGLAKVYAAQLGSGNPVRMLGGVRYVDSAGALNNIAIASANGSFDTQSSGNWATFSTSITLASERLMFAADYIGKAYMNNFATLITKQTDGVVGGAGSDELTSATAGDFAAAGVNANDFVVVITDGGDGVNEVQTATISGSPTGGTFTLKFLGQETIDLDYNATSAEVQYALEGLSTIGKGNVTASGSAGGPYTITFQETLGSLDTSLLGFAHKFTGGTSPTIAIAESTKGVAPTAGTFQITSVVTSTITLASSPSGGALSNVKFYIQNAPLVYDPSAATLTIWAATSNKGQVPTGCTQVVQHGARLWMTKEKNWFASRVDDPLDWDYAAPDTDVGRAVAGDVATTGNLGDYIKALISHADNCLLFGCTNSIFVLRGDPAANGRIYKLSSNIGMLDGKAWCHTPDGELWFLSLDGLYHLPAGCGAGPPSSVSREAMPQELRNIDDSSYTVTMAYDQYARGIHIYVSKNSAGATTHYWFDHEVFKQTGAASFWKTALATTDHDPFAIWERRDTFQSKSEVYLGGRDGYVRQFDDTVSQDDGANDITSYVFYGPIRLGRNPLLEGRLKEISVVTAASSGDVDIDVYVGDSPETAYNATLYHTHEFNVAGRNYSQPMQGAGNAAYLKVYNGASNAEWALESITLVTADGGRVKV